MRPVRGHGEAGLAGDRREVEHGGAAEDEVELELEGFGRRIGARQHLVAGAGELDVDAVLGGGGDAEAGRERHLALAVDGEAGGLLEARDVGEAEREDGVGPAYRMRVGGDLAHVGGEEAARQRHAGGVDDDVEDGAAQHLGGGLGLDVELLGQEYGAALLDLLDALVALHRLDADGIGHDQERAGHLLRRAPGARDLGLDLARASLALAHQPEHQHQRDQQQQDQEGDEEELEGRTARQPLNGAEQLLHRLDP